jgi:hypothetical protein
MPCAQRFVFGHVAAYEIGIVHQAKTLFCEFTKYFDVDRPLAKHGVGGWPFSPVLLMALFSHILMCPPSP